MTISAIIPVRNRPAGIERALDSVVAQTVPVSEVIVVDDCSTDDTPERVRARACDVPNLRLIVNRQCCGAPGARNIGAAAATGDLLAFLDSDDEWLPRKTEEQLALLSRHPECPAVGCNIIYVHNDRGERRSRNEAVVSFADLCCRNVLGSTSSTIVRRAAFEAIGGFRTDLPSCEDWDLWLRLAKTNDLRLATEPLLRKFQDRSGRISTNIDTELAGHAIVFASIYNEIADPIQLRRTKAAHESRLADIYTHACIDRRRALHHAYSALRLSKTPGQLLRFSRTLGWLAVRSARATPRANSDSQGVRR
jgi:glycosyltransferase involved in cell wall biosynthesis